MASLTLPRSAVGPPIDGWIWPSTARNMPVAWGAFYVVGGYDGTRFTFNETVSKDQRRLQLPFGHDRDFNTPVPSRPAAERPARSVSFQCGSRDAACSPWPTSFRLPESSINSELRIRTTNPAW